MVPGTMESLLDSSVYEEKEKRTEQNKTQKVPTRTYLFFRLDLSLDFGVLESSFRDVTGFWGFGVFF